MYNDRDRLWRCRAQSFYRVGQFWQRGTRDDEFTHAADLLPPFCFHLSPLPDGGNAKVLKHEFLINASGDDVIVRFRPAPSWKRLNDTGGVSFNEPHSDAEDAVVLPWETKEHLLEILCSFAPRGAAILFEFNYS